MGRRQSSFDRFTDRSRRVLTLAQEEAFRFNHTYIGPEHLLLGIAREGSGTAMKVLDTLGHGPAEIRTAVEQYMARERKQVTGEIGLTPQAKNVIELAVDEARRLGHHYVGTEHLLLGLIREEKGIAAGVLADLGVTLDVARTETIRALTQAGSAPYAVSEPPPKYVTAETVEKEGRITFQSADNPGDDPTWHRILSEKNGIPLNQALGILGDAGWELQGIYPPAQGHAASLYVFRRASLN